MISISQSLPTWLKASVSDYDPLAHARMKADTYNGLPGGLTGLDCPQCRNKGSIACVREDGTMVYEPCTCMATRSCILKMERSGMKNVIREYTLEKFLTDKPWQEKAKALAAAYADEPEGWFLACGQSGSGKTHLCTAICRELLLKGKQVVYMPWRQDVAEIKALSLDSDRRAERTDELKKAEYLYIDDLFKAGAGQDGTVKPTSSDISLAFEILNYRDVNKLPTLVSTEMLPEDLLRVDEAIGGRLVHKAKGNTLAIGKDMAKNFRLQGVMVL